MEKREKADEHVEQHTPKKKRQSLKFRGIQIIISVIFVSRITAISTIFWNPLRTYMRR